MAIRCLLLLLLCLPVLRGQEPAALPERITEVRDVHRLTWEEARNSARPVQLRGIVIAHSATRRFSFFEDDTGAIIVKHALDAAPPIGAVVEVQGVTGGGNVATDNYQPVNRQWVQADRFILTGEQRAPSVVSATVEDVMRFRHAGRICEIEATVLQAARSGDTLYLNVSGARAATDARLRGWKGPVPKNLIGARVKVRGLVAPTTTQPALAFIADAPHTFEVLQPGVADPFTLPAADAAALRRGGSDTSVPVKLEGIVTHGRFGDYVYLRSASGVPFQATLLQPYNSITLGAGEFDTAFQQPTSLAPGDVVELYGMPMAASRGLWLRSCRVRVMRKGEVPAPVVNPSLQDPALVSNELVTLTGQGITSGNLASVPGRLLEFVSLNVQGRTIEAWLDTPRGGQLPQVPAGHLVEVTGAFFAGEGEPLRVMLRGPGDFRLLGPDPAAARARFWQTAGIAGAGALLLGGWVFSMWRGLRKQRAAAAAVRALNASLEERVAERTAELEQARLDLARSLEHERELGAMRSMFVSTVSHEFRTPLAVILSSAELLKNHLERMPPDRREKQIDFIRDSTLQMSRLIDEVLLLGKVEAGKMTFQPRPVRIRQLCAAIADEALSATQNRCPVAFSCAEDVPETIAADETLLRHILGNLLSNASKYSPEGSPVAFHLAVAEPGGLEFTVTDEGIGIPEADRPHIFEAFHRASNAGQVSGTGLGLAIVKRCAELHGGTVTARPGAVCGSVFIFSLPISP